MCICEYDEAETLRLFKDEYYEEGREEMIFDLVNDELISSEIAAERLNLSVESFLKKLQVYNDTGKE